MYKQTQISLNNFYLKTWLTLCFITFLCYTPFIFNFTWGNHDWGWIKEGTPILSGLFEGRFSQFILQTLFFDGNILPIITLLTALTFFCSSSIILSKLYNIPQKRFLYLILGLFLTTAPYTISWLYFSFITLSCLSWPFFIILGYYLLNQTNQIISKQTIISTILFTLSIGGYPPTINLIGVIFFSLILNELTKNKITIKNLFQKFLPHIISILVSICLFVIIIYTLKKYNLMQSTYNTSQITPNNIIPQAILCLKTAFAQFFNTTTFINYTYKNINFILFLLSLYSIITKLKKDISAILIFIFATLGLLLSTTLTLFIAQNTAYIINEPRIDFFGILFIYTFSTSILIKSNSKFLKNITYLSAIIIIFYNINTLSYANKIWTFGFQAENKLSERIIARIENTPTFNTKQKYIFIQGGNLDFRSKYYISSDIIPNSYNLTAPYIPWHLPSKAYKFYQPNDFFGDDFDTFWSYIPPYVIYSNPNLIAYIQNNTHVWPQKNSIYIDNSTIILNLTNEGLTNSKRWLYEYNQNYPQR